MKRKAEDSPDDENETKRIKSSASPIADLAATKEAPRIVPFPEKVRTIIFACNKHSTDVLQPAVVEERNGEIEFRVVNNDSSRDSYIILTGLKCIFQKQLPKMPKDYIARLVYDRTHLSMAIVKKPLEVVG